MSTERVIRLVEDDDQWRAIEEDSGLEIRGETREGALEKLDEVAAVDLEADGGDEDLETPDELDWFEE